ncbi:hypothetical protein D0865_01426 [Hortaea werneckii]|uniref:Major facilitator superfamily (MFS) profile domain-containing protein n=1 Tax=Hortaea werneckii TaxID=91943 RepID=A0A3M7D925_HORWE|nr:hypothetical protein D0865_01426 [Hortaea werneckii]
MPPKANGNLTYVEPQPINTNERTPLLNHDQNETPPDQSTTLESQAAQEQREHDAGTGPIPDEPPLSRLLATMSCLWLATFFAAMDSTIVATLSTPITASFESGTLFSWIASGYLIANAATQPLSGKLTDIYGRKAGLVFATSFFAVGTLICGLAPTGAVEILGRVVAGMGGGCLNTISVFIASDLVPLRKRGVWQGVPFIVLSGVAGSLTIKLPTKESDRSRIRRVDFLGAFFLVATLVLLLLGLNSGGNIVPWNHPLVYVSLPLSAVCLALFIYIEDRVAPEPIIPVRLLLNRSVISACLTNWFVTMGVFAMLYYGPVYFQVVRDLSATEAGALFVPSSIGTALGSLGSGILMRATGRYYLLNVVMQILMITACTAILATFKATVNNYTPFLWMFMIGTSYGSMLTITLLSLIAAVDHKYQAVITSASYAFRSTGSSIGITIASAVFQNLVKMRLYDRFGDVPGAADEIRRIRDSLDEIRHLPPGWHDGVILSHVEALRGVWTVILGFVSLAAVVSLFMREFTLHSNLERK